MKTILARKIHLSPPLQGVQTNQFFRDVPEDQTEAMLARVRSINKDNPHTGATNEIGYYYESCEVVKS